MFRRILHFIPLVIIVAISVVIIVLGFFVHQKKVLTEELLIHPSRQLNTVWRTDENDVVFIVGDGESSNNFRAFALWDGSYVEVSLTCDYARQAELAIPGEDGIVSRYDGAIYLAVGTYHISEDMFSIEIDEELSSKEFVADRELIVLHKVCSEELDNSSAIKQLVLQLGDSSN